MMFDFSSSLFWYKLVFSAEIVLAELVFVVHLRRMPHFILRAVCSVAGLFLFAFLFPIVDYGASWTCFMFFMMFIVSLCGLRVCFNESLRNIIFCGLAAYTIQHIAFVFSDAFNDIASLAMGTEGGLNVYGEGGIGQSGAALAVMLVIYFVTYFVTYMIAHYVYTDRIYSDEVRQLGRKKFVVLAGIIIITDNILNAITMYNTEIDAVSLWVERCYNVFTCFLALQLQFSQLTEQNMQSKYDTVQRILQEERKQYLIVKNNLEALNIKAHDLKHRFLDMARSAGDRKAELDDIGQTLSVYESVVKTGNETLDLILTNKNLMYGDKHVQIACIADGTLLDFMAPTEIYSLFGNALDNAIEAVLPLEEDRRTISLFVKRAHNMVSIHIENYFSGERIFSGDLPVTTKADKEYHGYGMLSMKTVVEKYGGTMAVEIRGDVFCLNLLFPLP